MPIRRVVRELVAGAALLTVAAATLSALPAAAAGAVPYSDPAAVGTIGLCNQQGQQITRGSLSTAPFAWRAVSTAPAQARYSGASRTAILMAFQPIQGLAPGDWSGDQLTASSRYTNPNNPMAAATGTDWSLGQFLVEYKPQWDGFLQLRMYLGADNQSTYSVHYPVLDIQIAGNTWIAVDGGPVNCSAGSATSIESILLPASQLQPPGPSATSHPGAASSTPTTATATAGNAGHSSAPAGAASASPSRSSRSATTNLTSAASSSSSAPLFAALAAAFLLALAATVLVIRRRRGSESLRVDDLPTALPATGSAEARETDPRFVAASTVSATPSVSVNSTKGTTP